jgi:O-antigen/teichoic acid export membrane protein
VKPLTSIVRNWTALAGSQVVSSLIAMVLMVVISRTLGDVEFGRFYLALTLTMVVGVAVDFGTSQVVTRELAREPARTRPYLGRAALVVAVLGVGLYAAVNVAVRVLGFAPEVRSLVAILGLLMVAEGFAQLLGAIFQAHERMVLPALTRVGANAIALAVATPLLLRGSGATTAAVVIVLAAAARVAIQAVAVRRLAGFGMPPAPPPSWRGLLRAGFPFLAAQGLGLFVARVNVLILGIVASDAAVGWYAAASRVMEALNFIPLVLTMAAFPVLSRLWVSGRDEFAATVRKTLDLVLFVAVPVGVMLLVLAPDVVGFLFTLQSYGPAVPVLRIQAISLSLIFVDFLLVCVLMAIGRERTWLAIIGAACVLNPVLCWLFIPIAEASFGNAAIGAALATFASEVFILGSALRAVPRGLFGLGTLRVAAQALGLGAALGAVLVAARATGVPWVVAAAAGGAAYAAAVARTGVLPADVSAWLRGLVLRKGSRSALAALAGERGVDAA